MTSITARCVRHGVDKLGDRDNCRSPLTSATDALPKRKRAITVSCPITATTSSVAVFGAIACQHIHASGPPRAAHRFAPS